MWCVNRRKRKRGKIISKDALCCKWRMCFLRCEGGAGSAIANWGHGGLCLRKEVYLFEKLLFAIQERNLELFYFLSF